MGAKHPSGIPSLMGERPSRQADQTADGLFSLQNIFVEIMFQGAKKAVV